MSLWTAGPVFAKDKKANGAENKEKPEAASSAVKGNEGEAANKWAGVQVTISGPEREVIREYVHVHADGAKGKKKNDIVNNGMQLFFFVF